MGYIYEARDQANDQIKATYNVKIHKYVPIWNIIGERWHKQLHHLVHGGGFYLNSTYHYARDFEANEEVKDGLYECIEHIVPDMNDQDKYAKS